MVSDGLTGGSHVIVRSEPGTFFTVRAWLNDETLLIQSNPVACDPSCATSIWLTTTDGRTLTKVSDGTYLTLVDGYQP